MDANVRDFKDSIVSRVVSIIESQGLSAGNENGFIMKLEELQDRSKITVIHPSDMTVLRKVKNAIPPAYVNPHFPYIALIDLNEWKVEVYTRKHLEEVKSLMNKIADELQVFFKDIKIVSDHPKDHDGPSEYDGDI